MILLPDQYKTDKRDLTTSFVIEYYNKNKEKNTYKSNALFDPCVKVSVENRIEAFEQAGMKAPKLAVDIDAATRITRISRITRITRTKTREQYARAAAQSDSSKKVIVEKLARRSVAKAKKILLAKQNKDVDERRKEEDQQRLQRLQEQDEAERILAEQRRREQKAERRKETELRAQRQAAAEVMKTKHQMITSQTKYGSKQHGPTTYVLDSEPDDDESDDESRPKHTIPHWAQSHIRENQLAMQRYIPKKAVYNFVDSRKYTPDLIEMFENINISRSRLERTSSAIWKTPPRYSMMESE